MPQFGALFVPRPKLEPSQNRKRTYERLAESLEGYYGALPAYFGGKRRLAPIVFALLQEVIPSQQWRGKRLLDPFLGGGSISLQAKAQGFQVCCNDLALRSAVVGRAFIANDFVKLTPADLAHLLKRPNEPCDRFAEEKYSPSVFPRHTPDCSTLHYITSSHCQSRSDPWHASF
jgi:hypothetical protein